MAGQGGEAGELGADLGPLGPLIASYCASARHCCTQSGMTGALDNCEASFAAQSDNVRLVADGKALVDAEALARCVAAYETAGTTCTQEGISAACHGILVGTVADDGACTDALACDRKSGPKVCLKIQGAPGDIGTCKTPPRGLSGDPCAQSCENGAECSSTTSSPDDSVPITLCYEADGLYCELGYSCMPLVGGSQACTWNEACGSGQFCDSTCQPLGQSGDSCQFTFGCADGLSCVAGSCTPAPLASSYVCVGYPPSFD